MDTKIIELMQVSEDEHDIMWLKDSLQAALKLELATIPPYLCARWSIDLTQPNAAYPVESITTIVADEMRHMGLVCNMMTTLGFSPAINTPDAVPVYPSPLPGGVNPDLVVSLRKFSREQLEIFLEIEKPEHNPILPVESLGPVFATIGEFYDAILEAFKKIPAANYTRERQIENDEHLFSINNFSDVEKAIKIIKREGEGTEMSPEQEEDLQEEDLAHYYRFRELLWGKRFVKNEAGKWIDGDDIPFPTVYNMADIPPGGYAESSYFDAIYTDLLNRLQIVWETGDLGEFGTAIGLMYRLEEEAKKLMEMPIDDNDSEKGNFGPSFLFLN